LGLVVGKIERWSQFDALYWAFITATTVGYGDIRPIKKCSKILSVFLTFIGIMFAGIIVAITVNTATKALERHLDVQLIQQIKESIQ
jgi:voltage-gated potassium channel